LSLNLRAGSAPPAPASATFDAATAVAPETSPAAIKTLRFIVPFLSDLDNLFQKLSDGIDDFRPITAKTRTFI
jgi:hypothetical protein